MKNSSKKFGRGFTLIELLVAMAITTIIITILVSITSLSLDTWNRSRSEIRASRQGKAMIDSMTLDLESLVVRKGNNFEWLYAEFNPDGDGPKGTSSPNAADLVFFTAATDRYNGAIGETADMGGDVSTVAYQLKYKDPIKAAGQDKFKTFVLYRKLINPDVTFSSTLGMEFRAGSSGGDTLLTRAQNAAADPRMSGNDVDNEGNFICENVYQFTMTFHVEVTKSDGTLVSVPVQLGGGSDATELFKIGGSGLYMDDSITGDRGGVSNEQLKAGRLTSVEISLTVLTDFGLSQMRKRSLRGKAMDEFIAENTYQFSKIVPVPGS